MNLTTSGLPADIKANRETISGTKDLLASRGREVQPQLAKWLVPTAIIVAVAVLILSLINCRR
jgi:hypothetical protein